MCARQNPYHAKLGQFDPWVMRDEECERHRGRWNRAVFKRRAPLCLEIGPGDGCFMLEHSQKNPQVNFVGLDARFKRGFRLARKLKAHSVSNGRYLRTRAERLGWIFGESELDCLFCFFPDPWPKRRHHKKRLFQEAFLEAAYRGLRPGGRVFVKTDHEGYAGWMLDRIEAQNRFALALKTFDLWREFPGHFLAGFETRFEKRFRRQQIPIKAFEMVSRKPWPKT